MLTQKIKWTHLILIIACSIGFAEAKSTVENSPFSTASEKWMKGRILVQPKEGISEVDLAKILSSHGGKSIGKINSLNVHIVELPENANEKAVAALLAHNPHFKFAEVDRAVEMHSIPNDPSIGNAWHVNKMRIDQAWDTSTGTNVIIAILDTGVDGTHPDLAGHMVAGWNTFDNNNNTADIHGHGTKVAGAAAAIGGNGVGTAGVAYNAKIMPMRICDLNGYITYYSYVANAITWAADRGARVANISYGVDASSTVISAAQYMQNKGGVVVTSAGNSNTNMTGANTSTMITVGATDANDVKASWSSYGNAMDLVAPGVGIWTTAVGGYASASGTSFSSPIVAGVAALMISVNPSLTASQIESILKSTAVDLGASGRDELYGNGRVDAAAAVALAETYVPVTPPPTPADTVAPVVKISNPIGGTIVVNSATITASATDNVEVTGMSLYIDGALKATSTNGSLSYNWNTRKLTRGAHTVRVDARDAKGNVGTLSVQVSK